MSHVVTEYCGRLQLASLCPSSRTSGSNLSSRLCGLDGGLVHRNRLLFLRLVSCRTYDKRFAHFADDK